MTTATCLPSTQPEKSRAKITTLVSRNGHCHHTMATVTGLDWHFICRKSLGHITITFKFSSRIFLKIVWKLSDIFRSDVGRKNRRASKPSSMIWYTAGECWECREYVVIADPKWIRWAGQTLRWLAGKFGGVMRWLTEMMSRVTGASSCLTCRYRWWNWA